MNIIQKSISIYLLITFNQYLTHGLSEINTKETISCLTCEGESCLRTSTQNVTKNCDDDCVALFDGFTVSKRGCYSDLTTKERSNCDAKEDNSCYKCLTNKCNSLGRVDHTCLVCSSATNDACLNNPLNITRVRCPAPISSESRCFVRVNTNTTERGCLTTNREISQCTENEKTCSTCAVNGTDACNTIEFPVGRRKCIQCDANVDTNCPQNTVSSAEKSIYCKNSTDFCAILNKGSDGILQTCAENLSLNDIKFCLNNNASCIACNTNNCNTKQPNAPSSAVQINVQWFLLILTTLIIIGSIPR